MSTAPDEFTPQFRPSFASPRNRNPIRQVFFFLLMLAAAGTLLGGAGLLAAAYACYATTQRNVVTEPDEVRSLASEIAPVRLPPGFEPVAAATVQPLLASHPLLRWAAFADGERQSVVAIASFGDAVKDEAHLELLQKQFTQLVLSQGLTQVFENGGERLSEQTVSGGNAALKVVFTTRRDLRLNKTFLEAHGTFPLRDGKIGGVFILADTEKYDTKAVMTIIRSLLKAYRLGGPLQFVELAPGAKPRVFAT
jgi:hypothetical protein